MNQLQTIGLGTRVGAPAVDLAISAAIGALIAIAAGYRHQRYIEVGAEGTKLAAVWKQPPPVGFGLTRRSWWLRVPSLASLGGSRNHGRANANASKRGGRQ